MTAASPDPLLGTQVGSYRISRVLGQGGMGRVYAAEHPELGSRVAIKVIAEEHAKDRELTERFFAEARAVAMIHHDSIVNVIDLQRLADGRPVIVMELIDGETLRTILHRGNAPIGGVVTVMIEVLSALAAAHAVDIVHRDLKPDNILVTPSGRAKVLDFGIAKLMSPPPGQPPVRTRTGVILGTPEYMAPEQINGGTIDRRCDIYTAGVVLFEALTGRRPFDGPTDFDIMRHHIDTPPPLARALRREIPAELEQVILCALAKRPSDRFGNATAMANAMHAASASLAAEHWRSLAPSAPLRRPTPFPITAAVDTEPSAATLGDRPDAFATARATPAARGRLDGATLPAAGSPDVSAATRSSRPRRPPEAISPSPRPPRRRAPWLVPVIAAVGGAGVVAAVFGIRALRSDDAPAKTPPAPVTSLVIGPGSSTVPAQAGAPFSVPHGYDLKRFDGMAFIAKATELARQLAPDAQLAQFVVPGVGAGGRSDVTDDGPTYMFVAATKSALACSVAVIVDGSAAQVASSTGNGCEYKPVAPPSCTLAQVWERASQQTGRPDLVAQISLVPANKNNPQWWYVSPTGKDSKSLDIVDDCNVAAPTAVGAGAPSTRLPKLEHGNIPDRVDMQAFVAVATKRAQQIVPGAMLTQFQAGNVKAGGLIDAIRDTSLMMFSAADAVAPGQVCQVTMLLRGPNAAVSSSDQNCGAKPFGPRRCTLAQVWERASKQLQRPDLVADIALILIDGQSWNVDPDGTIGESFLIADDCK